MESLGKMFDFIFLLFVLTFLVNFLLLLPHSPPDSLGRFFFHPMYYIPLLDSFISATNVIRAITAPKQLLVNKKNPRKRGEKRERERGGGIVLVMDIYILLKNTSCWSDEIYRIERIPLLFLL